jgi:hypothetical protein
MSNDMNERHDLSKMVLKLNAAYDRIDHIGQVLYHLQQDMEQMRNNILKHLYRLENKINE